MSALAVSLAILVLVGGCSPGGPRYTTDFYADDPAGITRIIILDGYTGEMRELSTRDDIDAFFQLLDWLAFTRRADQERRTGYLYWVDLYEAEEPVSRVTFTSQSANVDGVYYDLDRNVKPNWTHCSPGPRVSTDPVAPARWNLSDGSAPIEAPPATAPGRFVPSIGGRWRMAPLEV